MPAQVVYAYKQFEVDLGRRELRANGVPIPIGGRAFEIVEVMVERGGGLVTHDELMERVWPGTAVAPNTIQVHISAVRKAFGPDRGLLKTASRRGYRLLGTWSCRLDSQPAGADRVRAPAPAQSVLSNLPVPASNLIGQKAAVGKLQDFLSAYRVVTLTGPGGIGKTRMAIEVGRGLASSFQGDVWLVELASLSDPALVPSAVAGVLGLALQGDDLSPTGVARAIGGRKLLLLLDNCEHVIRAAAELADAILMKCPLVSILATSRELLGIEGEHTFRVSPLSVPPQSMQRPQEALEHSAVELFMTRMRALRSDSSSPQEDIPAISAICRRLDGIPLAIEFAAARAASLGIQRVLSDLDDRFAFLTVGRRTALPRQQTLRATLDWSYQLLPPSEQRLLRCCAVFVGGFTLEAVAAIAGGTRVLGTSVEDGVANLITKSLITLDDTSPDSRYQMLETIRAYALQKLTDSGEAEPSARCHAEFFRDLFSLAASGGRLETSAEDMTRQIREIHNARAAIEWAFSPAGDPVVGVVLTAACVPVWLHMSLMVECGERVERALNSLKPESNMSPRLRLQLHTALGVALMNTMELVGRTGAVLANAIEIAEALGDASVQIRALWAMWAYHSNNGDNHAALSTAERFLNLAAQTGDPITLIVGDRLMSNTLHYRGDQPAARDRLERVLAFYAGRDQKDRIWYHYDQRVLARGMLARVLCLMGLTDQAVVHAKDSLDDALSTEHKESLCYALGECLSPVSLLIGDFDLAERSIKMLLDVSTKHGLGLWQGLGHCLEGQLLIKRGDTVTGLAVLRGAFDVLHRTGRLMHHIESLGVLAEALGRGGHFSEGFVAVDEALGRSEQFGERWCASELLRIRGDLLLADSRGPDMSAAENSYLTAILKAQQQAALFWELRATLSLSRLRVRQARHDEAQLLLAPVYNRFTEGFETADLRAASAMLDLRPYPGARAEIKSIPPC